MFYAGVLMVAIIVSVHYLLVESWIIYAASCYVMTLAMYFHCKVEFIGNNHHNGSTSMRHIMTFWSMTDHTYDCGLIIL
jgi:hypothetical protein